MNFKEKILSKAKKCIISNLYKKKIYLTCCIGVEYDNDLISCFIEYYKDKGVTDFLIILNTQNENSKKLFEAKKILKNYNIFPKKIWIGDFLVKLKNKYIRKMIEENTEKEDWIISTDIDEFHEYGVSLYYLLGECEKFDYECIIGKYIDRLSFNGKIKKYNNTKSIWSQYPVQSEITKDIFKLPYQKVVAHKSYLKIGPGHHSPKDKKNFDKINFYPKVLKVHHFQWREKTIDKLLNRIDTYKNNNYKKSWWGIWKFSINYYNKYNTFLNGEKCLNKY